MLDLATTVTNSGSRCPTLLPSIIVMRYVYDQGTYALGESILGKLQLLLYYLHAVPEHLTSSGSISHVYWVNDSRPVWILRRWFNIVEMVYDCLCLLVMYACLACQQLSEVHLSDGYSLKPKTHRTRASRERQASRVTRHTRKQSL